MRYDSEREAVVPKRYAGLCGEGDFYIISKADDVDTVDTGRSMI